MGGESLWKILWKPVENSRIVLLFPPSNAYETVDELETSCEKPVPSQPSLHVRDETMKKQITNGPPISNKSFKASSLACFNDTISPAKTKSFQSSIQGFYELFLSTRLMC